MRGNLTIPVRAKTIPGNGHNRQNKEFHILTDHAWIVRMSPHHIQDTTPDWGSRARYFFRPLPANAVPFTRSSLFC